MGSEFVSHSCDPKSMTFFPFCVVLSSFLSNFEYPYTGRGGGGGGGRYSTFVYTGRLRTEVPTPHPFIYHFSRKRYPFRMPSIDKWHPFHITSLELCIPFNFCNCTVFQIEINHRKRTVQSRLFKAIKCIFLALLGPFTDPNDRFAHPFIYFN